MTVLLATARPRFDLDTVAAATAARCDWTRLVGMALFHGTAGLLCRRALDIQAVAAEELRTAMATYLESCTEWHRLAVTELLSLLDRLGEANIAALAFKGPAFAAIAYAEPALRSCADLDILIRQDDVPAALEALAALGFISQYACLRADHREAYHRYNGQDCLTASGRAMAVEPHWQLTPRTLAISLDPAALFVRAQAVALGGSAVRTLEAGDALLVAALQGAKEEWTRLIRVADIAALLSAAPQLDARSVLDRATAAGIRRVLLAGIGLAEELLKAPCPQPFAQALAAEPAVRRLLGRAIERLSSGRPIASVFDFSTFHWSMRENLRDRVRYAAATLLTPRVKHLQLVDLPRPLRGFYPLVRVSHDFIALPLWRLLRVKA